MVRMEITGAKPNPETVFDAVYEMMHEVIRGSILFSVDG
jgi:Ni,Fe-hydrogenase III small subunit